MLRSVKVWVPCLFASLSLLGIILAATDTSIGPNNMYVRGQLAPWCWGAILGVMSLFAFLVSLWRWYLPDWERPYALRRTEELVGGRRVSVLMFPYSCAPDAFIAAVSFLIAGISLIGNFSFSLFLALPALALTMRATFGRQFIGLMPEGLVWRVMPIGSSHGGSDLRPNEVLKRQPVQFLPWSAISQVAIAEVVPSGSRPASASLMLQVSVSGQEALADLTHYQRVVPADTGPAVLIPLRETGTKMQQPFITEQVRAEAEVVWETIDHYLQNSTERGQIGSLLGDFGFREASCTSVSAAAALPKTPPGTQVVAETLGQDDRDAAQRLGRKASKAGPIVNAVLGVPYFVIVLILIFSGHLANNNRTFFPVTAGYLLLIVLPATVAFSSMLAAFAAPPGQERAYARVPQQEAVTGVVVLSVLALSATLYQYFDPANPGTTTISIPLIVVAILLTVLGLCLGGFIGIRSALAAKTGDPVWLTDQLSLWAKRLL